MLSDEQFATVYAEQYQTTVRFLISRGMAEEEARDLAQSAWTRGWERRAQLREDGALQIWINSIALNMLRTGLRHPLPTLPLTRANGVVTRFRPELNLIAEEVLRCCSNEDHHLFYERFFRGLSDAELAGQLGITRVAVRIRFYRAKQRVNMFFHVFHTSADPVSASSENKLQLLRTNDVA